MSLQALLFLCVFTFGLLTAVFRYPLAGLVVYIGVFFVHPPSRFWGASLPDLRWSFLAAAVALVATLLFARPGPDNPSNRFLTTPVVLVLLYIAYMWAQTLTAVAPIAHEQGTIIMTKYALVMFLFIKLANSQERLITVLGCFMLGCLYLGWLAGNANGVNGRVDGVGGPGIDDASSLGMVLACGVLVAGCIFLGAQRWWKWLAVLSLPLALNGLIATSSRGAFLALVMGGVAVYFLRPAGQIGRLAVYGALGFALVVSLASTVFLERIESLGAATDERVELDHSANSRIYVFLAQIEMLKDHPFGAGHKGTAALSTSYIDVVYHSRFGVRSSHNTAMSALVDQGIIGGILWFAIMLSLLRRTLQHRKQLLGHSDRELVWVNAAVGASLAAVLTAGMFSPQIKAEIYYWLIALTVALDAVIARSVAAATAPTDTLPAEPQNAVLSPPKSSAL